MKKFIKLTAFMLFTIYLQIIWYWNKTYAETEFNLSNNMSNEEIFQIMENKTKEMNEIMEKQKYLDNFYNQLQYENEYEKMRKNMAEYQYSYKHSLEYYLDWIQAYPIDTTIVIIILIIFILAICGNCVNKKSKSEKLDKSGEHWSLLSDKEKIYLKQTKKWQTMLWLTIFLPIISCIKYKRRWMLLLCIFEWLIIILLLDISWELWISDNPINVFLIGGIFIRIMATKNIIWINYNKWYFKEIINSYWKENKLDKKEQKEIIKEESKEPKKTKWKKIIIWIIILILIFLICSALIVINAWKKLNNNYETVKSEKELEEIKKSDEEILNENIEKLTDEFENKIYYILWDLAVEDKNFKEVAVIEKAITNGKLAKEYVNEYIIKLDKLIDDYESNGNIYNWKWRVNTSKEISKSLEDLINANIERLEYILSIQNSFFIKSDWTLMFYDSKTLKKYNELVKKHNEATKAFQKIIEENS